MISMKHHRRNLDYITGEFIEDRAKARYSKIEIAKFATELQVQVNEYVE